MATFQQWKPSQYTNMNETKKAHVDSGFEARGGDRQTYKTLGSALNPSSPRGLLKGGGGHFYATRILTLRRNLFAFTRIYEKKHGQYFTKIEFALYLHNLVYNANYFIRRRVFSRLYRVGH